jgi:hypothetical protein
MIRHTGQVTTGLGGGQSTGVLPTAAGHGSFEHCNNRWLTGRTVGEMADSLDGATDYSNNHCQGTVPRTADVLRLPDQIYETQLNNETCVITSVTYCLFSVV